MTLLFCFWRPLSVKVSFSIWAEPRGAGSGRGGGLGGEGTREPSTPGGSRGLLLGSCSMTENHPRLSCQEALLTHGSEEGRLSPLATTGRLLNTISRPPSAGPPSHTPVWRPSLGLCTVSESCSPLLGLPPAARQDPHPCGP